MVMFNSYVKLPEGSNYSHTYKYLRCLAWDTSCAQPRLTLSSASRVTSVEAVV